MRTFLSFTKRKYFRKILLLLTTFIVVFFIPFALLSYRSAKKNILNSINSSNSIVLSQISRNYLSFSQNITNVCLEIFFDNYIQNILYSKDISYSDIYTGMKNLTDTTLWANPSIHSISIYNGRRDEFFSVTSTGRVIESELQEYVKSFDVLPKLTPVLRPVTAVYNNYESQKYMISYFMYQFSDPAQNNESYLVINQRADWFIESMDISEGKNIPASAVYLVTDDYRISNKQFAEEDSSVFEALLDDFEQSHRAASNLEGFYITSFHNVKYLITYACLNNSDNFLIMIQNYDDVFEDLLNLRNDFLVIGILFFLFAFILLLAVSQRIYYPVNNIMGFFQQATDYTMNEFDFLKKTIRHERTLQPLALQYNLQLLLAKSDQKGIEQFCSSMPPHWLSACDHEHILLSVVLIHIDKLENNRFSFTSEDSNLLLYALKNITEELLTSKVQFSLFDTEDISYGILLNRETISDDVLSNVLQKLRTSAIEFYDITLTIALSDAQAGLTNLSSMYKDALTFSSYNFIFGGNRIITSEDCRLNEHNAQTACPPELVRHLESAIQEKDMKRIKLSLDDIKMVMSTFKRSNILICTISLVNQITLCLGNIQPESDTISDAGYNDIYSKVLSSESADRFFTFLYEYLETRLGVTETEDSDCDNLFISVIMNFVQRSYFDKNLSSQTISDCVGMSNRYTMRKFKSLTGLSLNDYINDIRMKKAASLLLNTSSSINDIAEQVGIDNVNYFYKLFKKAYGCTPREFPEYRERSKS